MQLISVVKILFALLIVVNIAGSAKQNQLFANDTFSKNLKLNGHLFAYSEIV